MAYFDDICKTVKEKLSYKITIVNSGFIVEIGRASCRERV